ncbi:MAG: DUF4132 domain-containing protein [bacterium]|nr:DUF4132 domain-containing protein [bacterium]
MSQANHIRLAAVFKELKVPEGLREVILTGTTQKPVFYYHYPELLEKLNQNGIAVTDPRFKNLVRLMVEKEAVDSLLEFGKTLWGNENEALQKTLDMMESSGIGKVALAMKITTYSSTPDKKLVAALRPFLFPHCREEIKKAVQDLAPGELPPIRLTRIMMDADYDFFEELLCLKLLGAGYDTANYLATLALVKNKNFLEETLVEKIKPWATDCSIPAKTTKEIIAFIKTGGRKEDFEKKLLKIMKKKSHTNGDFFITFVMELPDRDSDVYKRLFYISLRLSNYYTLGYFVDYRKLKSLRELEAWRRKYGVETAHMAAYLAEALELDYENKEENARKLFKEVLAENFAGALEGLERVTDEQKGTVLEMVWEHDLDFSFGFILSCAGASTKKPAETAIRLLTGYEHGVEAFREMLQSKKQAVRAAGVRLLIPFNKKADAALLKEMADNEKAVVKAAIDLYFETNAPDDKAPMTRALLLEMVEKQKPKEAAPVKWMGFLTVETLPEILWKEDSQPVPTGVVNFLLKQTAAKKSVAPVPLVQEMAELFEKESLFLFNMEAYIRWDLDSKSKWVTALISTFGDDRFVAPLGKQIEAFTKANRGKMAAYMVEVLAYMGSPASILAVETLARKGKHKQVKNAAEQALKAAAQNLGVTHDQLLDMIIPDFGFGTDGTRTLDYGPRSFRLAMANDLSLSITDGTGKTFKNLPKPGKRDDGQQATEAYELFKTIKKDLKKHVKMELERLEEGLAVLRLWTTEKWKRLFIKNPIMHRFALGLIWGIYTDGKLRDTFRYLEDGTFNTAEEEEFLLPDEAEIGLVHPVELSQGEREEWLTQLQDYEILQPFNQLVRPVYTMEKGKGKKMGKGKVLNDFMGFMITRYQLKSKLLKFNWHRGRIRDGGVYYEYFKENEASRLGVQLNFLGDTAGWYEQVFSYKEVPVYSVFFYDTGNLDRKNFRYDRPSKESHIPLAAVPARYYSEIYHQIKSVLDMGSGFNEEWERVEM